MGLALNFLRIMNPTTKMAPAITSIFDKFALSQDDAFPLNKDINKIDNPADAIRETTDGLRPFKAPFITHKSWYL